MERYTTMYPRGQPGLPDDPVTSYVNNFRTIGTTPGSTTNRRARITRRHDPTWECNICVASASSSSEPKPAPRHRGANAQRRARLDELVEGRRQLDEELDLLHQELGMDAGRSCAGGAPRGERRPARAPFGCRSAARLRTYAAGTQTGAREQPTRQRGREHQRQHRR
jgi:hypothetical protein